MWWRNHLPDGALPRSPPHPTHRAPSGRRKGWGSVRAGGGACSCTPSLLLPSGLTGSRGNGQVHSKRPGRAGLRGPPSWTGEGGGGEAFREVPSPSLTFQVTWMLCEVTGCKVTSMGGPSGAGSENSVRSQVLEGGGVLRPQRFLRSRGPLCASTGLTSLFLLPTVKRSDSTECRRECVGARTRTRGPGDGRPALWKTPCHCVLLCHGTL